MASDGVRDLSQFVMLKPLYKHILHLCSSFSFQVLLLSDASRWTWQKTMLHELPALSFHAMHGQHLCPRLYGSRDPVFAAIKDAGGWKSVTVPEKPLTLNTVYYINTHTQARKHTEQYSKCDRIINIHFIYLFIYCLWNIGFIYILQRLPREKETRKKSVYYWQKTCECWRPIVFHFIHASSWAVKSYF